MRPEDRLQSRCAKYLKSALPVGAFFSGIEHARKQSVYSGQIQKAKGIKAGLPDLSIWWNRGYYAVELKVKAPVSDGQRAFGLAMVEAGFVWVVVRSVLELDAFLRAQGFPVPESMRYAAMDHDAKLAAALPVRSGTRSTLPQVKRRPSMRAVRKVAAMRARVLF